MARGTNSCTALKRRVTTYTEHIREVAQKSNRKKESTSLKVRMGKTASKGKRLYSISKQEEVTEWVEENEVENYQGMHQ